MVMRDLLGSTNGFTVTLFRREGRAPRGFPIKKLVDSNPSSLQYDLYYLLSFFIHENNDKKIILSSYYFSTEILLKT